MERDENLKQVIKLQGKEKQYLHEIKNERKQADKISEQLKAKMFRETSRQNNPHLESANFFCGTLPNEAIQFSNGGAIADFNRMMTQELEQKCRVLRDENLAFRDCLKVV